VETRNKPGVAYDRAERGALVEEDGERRRCIGGFKRRRERSDLARSTTPAAVCKQFSPVTSSDEPAILRITERLRVYRSGFAVITTTRERR